MRGARAPHPGYALVDFACAKHAWMLYEDRDRAESFGAVAELYDRARPSYPPALIDDLVADVPARVIDVGCGTGIAGALLAARGCHVLGVEADERMAALARSKGLRVEVGRFERWADRGRRFDLLVSAQAWHWIAPDAGVPKAAEVLAEGGRIGLFWNFGDPPPEVRERLAPIYERLAPRLENYSVILGNRTERGRETIAPIVASPRFGTPEVRRFPWTQTYDRAAWLAHLETHSDHQALEPPRRQRLLSAVGDAIDALGGSFQMPYETVLVTARMLPLRATTMR